MAMLAERRRKVQYIVNPKKTAWTTDENKFGQKLLEKMGWTSGKGLGAKEDGMQEPIHVKQLRDQKGIGFEDKNDQWTTHEDNFSELLKTLQNDPNNKVIENQDTKKVGLEEKSKSSKSRVHYQKFTRGKDLSRYSEKDLANIFGRKTLEKPAIVEEVESTNNEDENRSTFGVTTYSRGSMTDYFKKKLSNVRLLGKSSNVDENENNSDYDDKPVFGLGFGDFVNNDVTDQSKGYADEEIEAKTKKRKRDANDIVEPKLKKKSKSEGIVNEAFNSNSSETSSITCNPYEITPKKVKILNGIVNPIYTDDSNIDTVPEEVCPDGMKKKSKKNKSKTSGVMEEAQIPMATENVCEDSETSSVAKKKHKKAKKSEINNEVNISQENVQESENKIKKKKSKNLSNGILNPGFCEITEVSENVPENDMEVKRKKSKKSKKSVESENKGVNNPTFNTVDTPELLDNNQFEITVKEKKGKKKHNDISCMDNSAGEITQQSIDNGQSENIPTEELAEPPVKKSKKKKSTFEVSRDDLATNISSNAQSIEETSTENKSKKKLKKSKYKTEDENCGQVGTPTQELMDTTPSNTDIEINLMLNVVSVPEPKPILHTPQSENRTRPRKSVRIDESLNQQRIIPNLLGAKGLQNNAENELFDINAAVIRRGITNPAFTNAKENVQDAEKQFEKYQAEVENNINEQKQLKSDKEVVYEFPNANLQEIKGYAPKSVQNSRPRIGSPGFRKKSNRLYK